MPKVLVTGGSGFFGIQLSEALLRKGYSVTILDTADLESPGLKEKVEFIKGDVRDKEALSKACKGADFVFHNAAVLPISRYSNKIFRDVNVTGTRNVLEASLNSRVKRVVFISSSAPYGIPKEFPITESTPFNPVEDYGRSKAEAEKVCKEFRGKGLDVVILRPRTIVGKGRLGLFQILFSWMADNRNIYIIGNGNNLFQYLSSQDLVSACILSIEKDCRNEDINLGTDRFKTVKEDLQGVIDHAKSRSKIVPLPAWLARAVLGTLDFLNVSPLTPWHYRTPDKPFYFDISKAKRVLGWHPVMSNADMFRESYDWYLSRRQDVDNNFGITHRRSVRQRILGIVKRFS